MEGEVFLRNAGSSSLAREGTSTSPEADPHIRDLEPKSSFPESKNSSSCRWPSVERSDPRRGHRGDDGSLRSRCTGNGERLHYPLLMAQSRQGRAHSVGVPQAPRRAGRRPWMSANPQKLSPPHPHLGILDTSYSDPIHAAPSPTRKWVEAAHELCPSCPWPQARKQFLP